MYSEAEISGLRESVRAQMSEKRYLHTLGVERMARRIAHDVLPDAVDTVAVAALLHDLTKEMPTDGQIALLEKNGFTLTDADREAVGVLHSFTAPYVIREKYPQYALPEILSAVHNHTVGAADMSLADEILFVADFIEDGREYPACKEARARFEERVANGTSPILALHYAALDEIERTEEMLKEHCRLLNPRIEETKSMLLSAIDAFSHL